MRFCFYFILFLFLEVIIMAWTTPSTASVGGALTAALWNSDVRDNLEAISRGIIVYAAMGTQTGLSTTLVDISGLSVTWTAKAGQNYLVLANVSGTVKQTNSGGVIYQLTDGSNTVKDRIYQVLAADATMSKATMWEFIRNASAGSTTRKIRQLADNSGGVFNRSDVSDNLSTFIVVFDLGNTTV